MANNFKTLQELSDSHNFDQEPVKNKKFGSGKVKVADWTLNSRYLLIHLFYNVLGMKAPRNTPKNKLPSIDKETLERFGHPLAKKLIEFREKDRTLKSLLNAMAFIRPGEQFDCSKISSEFKAVMNFAPVQYDSVERIYSESGNSLPINADKRVRNALVTPTQTVDSSELDDLSKSIVESLL